MAIPDPAITDWVPVWNPQTAGPIGPQGPQGPPGVPSYAEGTWLPKLVIGTTEFVTGYGIQLGVYVKVGSLVSCSFDVQVATVSGATGAARLSNFPFANNSTLPSAGSVGFYVLSSGAVYNIHFYMFAGLNAGEFPYKIAAGVGTDGSLQAGNFGPGARVIGAVTYRV